MATLTTAQKTSVQEVIDYLQSGYEKPIDQWASDRLSNLHAEFGYPSQITFLDGLRDAPHSTLLKSLLNVAA
jgi:hypothetical protein